MTAPKFKVGDRVRHVDFGPGSVVEVDTDDLILPFLVLFDSDNEEDWCYGSDLSLLATTNPSDPYHDKKHDKGKSRMDLLPFDVLFEIGKVLEYGCRKYSEDSWQTVPEGRKRYTGALLRHLAAMKRGETHDEESGHRHAAHMATNALFVCWLYLQDEAK